MQSDLSDFLGPPPEDSEPELEREEPEDDADANNYEIHIDQKNVVVKVQYGLHTVEVEAPGELETIIGLVRQLFFDTKDPNDSKIHAMGFIHAERQPEDV